jgi:hypothetical protein
MENKKPTLEEVKEYFKNAKEVKCANSNDTGFVEFDKIEKTYISGELDSYIQNPCKENWIVLWIDNKYAKIISYKEEIETPKHYDNSKGSIYQFCENQNLNSYEFDIIKRVVRSRKKGNFKEDLEKTKFLIDLYLKEYEE